MPKPLEPHYLTKGYVSPLDPEREGKQQDLDREDEQFCASELWHLDVNEAALLAVLQLRDEGILQTPEAETRFTREEIAKNDEDIERFDGYGMTEMDRVLMAPELERVAVAIANSIKRGEIKGAKPSLTLEGEIVNELTLVPYHEFVKWAEIRSIPIGDVFTRWEQSENRCDLDVHEMITIHREYARLHGFGSRIEHAEDNWKDQHLHSLLNKLHDRDTEIAELIAARQSGKVSANPKSESNYRNIVGALLKCIFGEAQNVKPHPSFLSQAMLIETIETLGGKRPGLSKRNLEEKFRDAKKAFDEAP